MLSKDLTSKRFGKLTALHRCEKTKHGSVWECLCDCGTTTTVRASALQSGNTQSCGCLRKERLSQTITTHGMTKHPAFRAWANAKQRCQNPNNNSWKYYGGKGVEFRLPDFEKFWIDMGGSWFEGATIDRIDVTGHYEIGNVRWVDHATQMRNTTRSIKLTHDGVTQTVSEWARSMGISRATLLKRAKTWSAHDALTKPIRGK